MTVAPQTAPRADQAYTEAHDLQYVTRDLPRALASYVAIMAAHPDAEEAAYARAQIHNLAKSVLPAQTLVDALVALTEAHLAGAQDADAPA